MTLSANALPPAGDDFDSGPLSWVMGEIRETVGRSMAALAEAFAQDADADARNALLRQARTHLHQAHGALQIVDVEGVAILTETIEDLFDRLESAQLTLTAEMVEAIDHACAALVEYLEELLAGAPPQPVRLFPYYRALLQARGAERIHPADLFFPNLAIRPLLPPHEAVGAGAAPVAPVAPVDYVVLRKRFEKGLLPLLRGIAGAGGATEMSAIIGEVEHAQSNQQSRGFWWVMRGFAEAVESGQIPNELYVKQLFARINLQLRRLSEGSGSITERLLRDALFFIARVAEPSPRLRQIRDAYRLDGQVPADFERKRYGQIDPVALAAARARLAQAKTLWNRIAGGDPSVAAAFENEMLGLSEAGASLNAPSLAKLLRELNGISRAAARANPGDRLGLEMATSLLFVEHALGQIGSLDAHFGERADALTARLLSIVAGEEIDASAPWLDDISRQAQQRQTMVALTGELQSSLRQVEKTLEEYFARPVDPAALAPVTAILHQVGGALAVLDQDDAVRAVTHTQDALRGFAEAETPPDPVASQPQFQQIARNIGALGFFIETLQLQGDNQKKRFHFDDRTGIFQATVVSRDTIVSVDVPPIADDNAVAAAPHGLAALAASGADALASTALPDGAAIPEAHRDPDPAVTTAEGNANAEALPTVEEDLLFHQQAAERLAQSVCAAPAETTHRDALRQALQQVMRDASLIDHPHANERAKAAIALLDSPDFTTATTTHAALLAATTLSAVPPAAEPLASVAAPDSEEGIDAELLEIFLTEAVEVLEAVSTTLPAARSEPHQQEHLTTLRRSFHTLKGSGRMVGLMSFGEAAWSIEQVMNQRLSESRGGDADLYALLEMAHDTLGRWVDDLQRTGRSSATGDRLIAAAGRLIAGLPVGAADMEALPESHESDAAHGGTTPLHETAALQETIPQHETVAPHDAAPLQAPEEPEELQLSDDEMRLFGEPAAMTPESVAPVATAPVAEELPILLDADELALPAALQDAETPAAEAPLPSLLDPFDFMPFDAGTEQSGTPPAPATPAAIEVPELIELEASPAGPAVANLAGTAAVIEFPTLLAPDPQRNDNVKQIGALEIGVPLYNIYLAETDELVRLLSHDFDEWRHEPERRVNVAAVHAAHSLAGTSATVGFKPLQEIAHGLEAVLQQLARMPVRLLDTERDMLDQVLERIRFMLQLFALGEMAEHEPQQVALLHALQQAVTSRAEAAEAHEQAASLPEPPSAAAMPADPDALAGFAEAPAASVAAPQNNAPVIAPAMAAAFARSGQGSAPEILPQSTVQVKDELDPDLMPVFTEEANDMLPQMGQILRAWQLAPGDPSAPQSLLRLLHTIKGSARMAGAMRLGQHMHEMESRIEQVMHLTTQSPHVFEDLLARHDHGLQMFDSLLNPQAAAAATTAAPTDAVIAATYDGAGETESHRAAESAAVMPPAPEQGGNAPTVVAAGMTDRREMQRLAPDVVPVATAPVPLVRVRADILDRLVNQAGEVSISRSRLENEVDAMRQSMIELTENVARLREQLREVEMQAESQIANQTSQRSNAPDGQFDPLEFDRFTRLQELTRMMAESVNDVGSVQQNLARTLDSASGDLSIQARLTRELQQDLMSVRMVQFASISERLYRVTRQASKEVDKRVNLDIRGSAVEIDRSVLEKMAGPFEHLLRNAIVHGIEMRAARQSAGKNEVGELLIEVRQEGNEVVIQFSDDGQGLDLERIRNKAMQTGLLTDESVITDGELTDLIFHPGFSTAAEVTELAGRGVGMDVVRSEATALGGRVEIISTPGKGAQFTVHLPLTLAVTQVLLLTTGGKTYAVPSVLIEQVQQLKTQALAAAYNEGAVTWQSQRVPMAYLAALLGDAGVSAVAQQYSPLIILKSGNNRIAIHVDEILGNREVVVKNIGPQLSRLTGIAGATVLGSGEIVLILNPVALAQRVAEEGMRAARPGEAGETASMGAVAEFGSNRSVQPVAGLRTQNIVMVVDDSLTVRRVTQRLLSREGYQVVLAKDGVDALEQLQSITPDVMLVDIEMPRMDGFDLTRNIRDDERTRHIPIIMITSRTASKHRNFAFELGVNEYLGKPYQEDMLLASVAGFLKKDSAIS